MTRTITRLFDSYADAERGVLELERIGVHHNDISLIAHNGDNRHEGLVRREPGSFAPNDGARVEDGRTAGETKAGEDAGKGAGAGAVIGGLGGLLAGLGMLAIPGVGPVVAAGWLASTAVGAAAGAVVGGAAGGLVGALQREGVPEEDAHVYAEGVRRGGTLVSARVEDGQVIDAEAALDRANAVNARDRGVVYRESGWSRFDEAAPAYRDERI
jgi:hypothetical protein